jgi:hypothetical protein
MIVHLDYIMQNERTINIPISSRFFSRHATGKLVSNLCIQQQLTVKQVSRVSPGSFYRTVQTARICVIVNYKLSQSYGDEIGRSIVTK